MIKPATQTDEDVVSLSIDHLQLTLKTTRRLKAQGIERIGQLVERMTAGVDDLQLEPTQVVELKEVLASRGI